MTTVSQAEFARQHNVSRAAVGKWKVGGYVVMAGDLVDVEASDRRLADAKMGRFKPAPSNVVPRSPPRKPTVSTRPAVDKPPVDGSETDPDAVAETIEAFLAKLLSGQVGSQADAERIKENALAGQRALEFRRQAGSLIDRDTAESVLFSQARLMRDAWMNWPSRIGPVLAAELNLPADRVTEALTRHVHQQLATLAEPAAEFDGP